MAVKLLWLNWRWLIGFCYIIFIWVWLLHSLWHNFFNIKLCSESEGWNHIVKAPEALCEKGACLPFVRNIVEVQCLYLYLKKLFLQDHVSEQLTAPYFKLPVLGDTSSLYGVHVTCGGSKFLCKIQFWFWLVCLQVGENTRMLIQGFTLERICVRSRGILFSTR
jgi:hypothetical protein